MQAKLSAAAATAASAMLTALPRCRGVVGSAWRLRPLMMVQQPHTRRWSSSAAVECDSPVERQETGSEAGELFVPFYNFKRFERMYMHNKQIRFPVDMNICPFNRPEADDSEEEVLDLQLAQPTLPISQLHEFLPQTFEIGMAPTSTEKTKHADSLFLGLAEHPQTGKMERYLLKFFPASGEYRRNALREVVFSYLLVEAGMAQHAPKIGLQKIGGLECIIRRFYDGRDGRFLLHSKADLPNISDDVIIANFAIRYVLFADLDMDNPGNIIFTRHSGFSGDTILNIDGEEIMPDEKSMRGFADTLWQPGDPIPGSFAWRQARSNELGDHEFFKRQMESENGLLAMLRARHGDDPATLAKLRLCPSVVCHALEARPYFEQLARSFGIHPIETLRKGKADFQITLDRWARHLNKYPAVPINLFHLCTASYPT